MRSLPAHADRTITFAIPYYRGLDLLRRALDSVRAQSDANWRLLLCDDGSDEPAHELLEEYHDSRIRYLRNPRTLGMAGNWNRCLDAADTDLVTLLHADDELRPDYAKVMSRAAVEHPQAVALFCRAHVIDERGQRVFSLPDRMKDVLAGWSPQSLRLAGPGGITWLLRGCFIMCPTMCYRRSVLGSRRFDPRWKMVLDLDFFSRLLADGDEFIGVPAFAYAYRRHANHATAAYNESLLRFHEEAALYDEIAAHAHSHGWHDVERIGRAKQIVRLHLAYRLASALAAGRLGAARERFALLWRLSFGDARRQHPCASP